MKPGHARGQRGGGLTRVRESIRVSPAKCLLRCQYRRLPTRYYVDRKKHTYYSSRSHSLWGVRMRSDFSFKRLIFLLLHSTAGFGARSIIKKTQ